jgi:NAD-dependent SIR2 family protein deacetylase
MITPEQQKVVPAFRTLGSSDWQALVAKSADDNCQQEEARKAKDELKNALLASLQMQHLVVLAGSGCSRSAGGPSMQDLWNGAVGEEPRDCAKATAEKVHHDLEDKNIEALLSRIEAFLQVNQDDAVSTFLSSSKQVILDRCSQFLYPGKLTDHETFLHRLSRRRVRDQRLKVFTTNYDLCFERAAAALGGVALDGFSITAECRGAEGNSRCHPQASRTEVR